MQRTTWGNHLDPYTSWLVLRSLESVAVRTERAMNNARGCCGISARPSQSSGRDLSRFLGRRHKSHVLFMTGSARRQVRPFRSTCTAERLRHFACLTVCSYSKWPSVWAVPKHSFATRRAQRILRYPPEQRLAGGITDGTIRLSVGFEHVDDLIG
jgi:methionine-gamma-lyase